MTGAGLNIHLASTEIGVAKSRDGAAGLSLHAFMHIMKTFMFGITRGGDPVKCLYTAS
jgi:hypothetical protein